MRAPHLAVEAEQLGLRKEKEGLGGANDSAVNF